MTKCDNEHLLESDFPLFFEYSKYSRVCQSNEKKVETVVSTDWMSLMNDGSQQPEGLEMKMMQIINNDCRLATFSSYEFYEAFR